MTIFEEAGFDAYAARLPVRFVPATGDRHSRHAGLLDWLDYYNDQKLLLRFAARA